MKDTISWLFSYCCTGGVVLGILFILFIFLSKIRSARRQSIPVDRPRAVLTRKPKHLAWKRKVEWSDDLHEAMDAFMDGDTYSLLRRSEILAGQLELDQDYKKNGRMN